MLCFVCEVDTVGFFLFVLGFLWQQHTGMQDLSFLNLLHWKHRVLTIGPPGKSRYSGLFSPLAREETDARSIYYVLECYFIIYIFGCAGSLMLCKDFLWLGGLLWLSCTGFSLPWLLLCSMGSRAHGRQ